VQYAAIEREMCADCRGLIPMICVHLRKSASNAFVAWCLCVESAVPMRVATASTAGAERVAVEGERWDRVSVLMAMSIILFRRVNVAGQTVL